MPDVTSAKDAGFFIYSCFVVLLLCNAFMCRKYGRDVYIIWYIFWLFFVVSCGLEYIADGRISNLCQKDAITICDQIYDSLIDPQDEVRLLIVGLAIIIVPQVATYIITAPFGCASTPLFVSQAMNVARWSLVKFLAGAGAILLAEPSAKLLLHKSVALGDFVAGLMVLSSGFLYGLISAILEFLLDFVRITLLKPETRRLAEWLVRMQQRFRKNRTRRRYSRVLEIHMNIPELNQTLRTRTRLRIR